MNEILKKRREKAQIYPHSFRIDETIWREFLLALQNENLKRPIGAKMISQQKKIESMMIKYIGK